MNRALTAWIGSLALHLLLAAGFFALTRSVERPIRVDLSQFQLLPTLVPAAETPAPSPSPETPPTTATSPPKPAPPPAQPVEAPLPEPVPSPAEPLVAPREPATKPPEPEPVAAAEPQTPPQPEPVTVAAPPETPATAAKALPLAASRPAEGNPLRTTGDRSRTASAESEEARVDRYLAARLGYIRTKVMSNLHYPALARRQGWSGRVKLEFTVQVSGEIADLRILESSGFPLLDKQALRAVNRAVPFPPPPVVATVTLPVTFRLN